MKHCLKATFNQWIFNSYSNVTAEGLGLYRIFSALFILSFLLPSTEMYGLLGSLPSDFYNPPPGPMMLFEGFPSINTFYLVHIILCVALLALLIGYQTRAASIVTGLALLIIKGFFYSVGKINHDLFLSVMPMVMAFSNWGKAYSVDSFLYSKPDGDTVGNGWPLTLLALILGFMMFTAGFPKILGGWLDLDTQAVFGRYFRQYFVHGRQDLLADYGMQVNNSFLWELLDYATIFFEIGFLAAVIHPRTTRLFISIAVIFHFSTMLLLNISFLPNFVVYAAFLNWTKIHHKVKQWFAGQWSPVLWLAGLFGLIWVVIFAGDKLGLPDIDSDLTMKGFYVLLFSMPVALYYIISQFFLLVRNYSEKYKTR